MKARHLHSRFIWGGFLLGLLACLPPSAFAHKASDSYLTLRTDSDQVAGEWHLALRDLDSVVGLDTNEDGAITWKELRSREAAVVGYALNHLQVWSGPVPGRFRFEQLLVDHHSDGAYAVVRFLVEGLRRPSQLEVNYSAFFDQDRLHRGLLRLENGGPPRLAVFGPDSALQHFDLAGPSHEPGFWTFVREGIWHIWTGYDHLLFLTALLLPGVLKRPTQSWEPEESVASITSNILKTVTAFTVAHSITLGLAAFGLFRLPPRFVESAIAFSVALAALNNLVAFFPERVWPVAFGFGLIHGFGFANALADLGLSRGTFAATLFGFNAGVEIGQLAVVAVFLPVALLFRFRPFYRARFLPAGSSFIALVAVVWLAERVFDFKCLPL